MDRVFARYSFGLILAILAVTAACNVSRARISRDALPSGLFVPEDAVDLTTRSAVDGTLTVTYQVTIAYPATSLLAEIKKTLSAPKWQPLANDWLSRKLPASHTRGWVQFADQAVLSSRHVHQWRAQWLDSAGNVVAYTLRYDSPARTSATDLGPPENRTLSVAALRVPARVAMRLMDGSYEGADR